MKKKKSKHKLMLSGQQVEAHHMCAIKVIPLKRLADANQAMEEVVPPKPSLEVHFKRFLFFPTLGNGSPVCRIF